MGEAVRETTGGSVTVQPNPQVSTPDILLHTSTPTYSCKDCVTPTLISYKLGDMSGAQYSTSTHMTGWICAQKKSGDFYLGSRTRDSANRRSDLNRSATVACIRSNTRHRGRAFKSRASVRGMPGLTPKIKISRLHQ